MEEAFACQGTVLERPLLVRVLCLFCFCILSVHGDVCKVVFLDDLRTESSIRTHMWLDQGSAKRVGGGSTSSTRLQPSQERQGLHPGGCSVELWEGE